MGKRILAVAALLLVALSFGVPSATAGGGCHSGQFLDERGVRVDLRDLCFTPTVVRIQPGQSVTWTNRDEGVPHTVTGAAFRWGSTDELGYGQSVTLQFRNSGVYPYACLVHPGMVGAVVVGDGTSAKTSDQDVVPVVITPPPVTPAPNPVPAVASSRGVSGLWRAAAIAGFALLLVAAAVLAAQFAGRKRDTARA